MKKLVRIAAACALALSAQTAWATPSTVFWTPATTYVQPFLLPHLTFDTYFNDKAAYPINLGLTVGILPFEKVQAEVGIDFFFPYWGNAIFVQPAGALQLNAKAGLVEGAFGEWFPGITGGIYGVGVNQGTQFSVLHAEVGKTFFFGAVTVGGYYGAGGTNALWSDIDGVVLTRGGFMASYVSPDLVLDLKGIYKLNFVADIMTGNSAFSAAGGGVAVYFTPAIDVITGPLFFLNKYAQPGLSNMMWTVQLDVDFDLGAKEPAKS